MNVKKLFILLFISLLSLAGGIFFSKTTLAEIATTWDWVGLFPASAGHTKADTVNGNTWAYTSTCSQATPVPNAVPKLEDSTGCNLVPNPLPTSGTYEYRMYANNKETTEALIAKSGPISADPIIPPPPPVGSNNCPTQSSNPRVRDGLITTPDITGSQDKFGNDTGSCVIDSKSTFIPFKIPTYEELKSIYFTQSKAVNKPINPSDTIIGSPNANTLYHYNYTGTTVSTPGLNYTYSTGAAIFFVDHNLNINGNITGTAGGGLVLVVGGNVNIASQSVNQIDAVIISQGVICTAFDGTTCLDGSTAVTQKLTVNGSLISLTAAGALFKRNLADNSEAAEVIYQNPKYLVILKDLFSNTLQKWSEIQ